MPMDDASSVPGDPSMNEPIGGPEQPMDGPAGDMGAAPMDEPPMGGQEGGMEEPPMDSPDGMEPGGEEGGTGDSTIDIINKLSDTDKEAVRAYAESMLDRSENQGEGNMEPGMEPMAESVIFTKKQLSKINENLINMDKDDNKKNLIGASKPNKKLSKKSPFSSPKFK
jgi:hypothetical protein